MIEGKLAKDDANEVKGLFQDQFSHSVEVKLVEKVGIEFPVSRGAPEVPIGKDGIKLAAPCGAPPSLAALDPSLNEVNGE